MINYRINLIADHIVSTPDLIDLIQWGIVLTNSGIVSEVWGSDASIDRAVA